MARHFLALAGIFGQVYFLQGHPGQPRKAGKAALYQAFFDPWKKSPYFIALDKYEPRFGALKGKRLNAWESKSWKSLAWEDGTDDSTDGYIDGGTEGGTDDRTDAAPNPEVTRSNQISQINQNPQNAGGGSSSNQHEPQALSDAPITVEEREQFKRQRLGEWEQGVLTRMVSEGTWKQEDANLAIRLVLGTPESYPDGITFQAFQGLVEAAAMVVRQ